MSESKELEYELNGGDQCVHEFAEAMKLKMALKAGKYGSPKMYTLENLKEHLHNELQELADSNYSTEECVDVANMCYLIWNKQLEPLREVGED